MRRYERISGMFFALVAIAQLSRAVLGWPVMVATITVPTWASVIAFLITATFAIWAFRASRSAA